MGGRVNNMQFRIISSKFSLCNYVILDFESTDTTLRAAMISIYGTAQANSCDSGSSFCRESITDDELFKHLRFLNETEIFIERLNMPIAECFKNTDVIVVEWS